eukprot:4548042-Prorocentrum_lima.AAC.1
MGDFQGGLLWVESKEGLTLPPYTAPGLGPSVKRSNHVTKGKSLNFYVVFFNSKSLHELSLDAWQ